MEIKAEKGVASFIEKYDAFILDIWGVLMDGLQPYPGAINCLEKLRSCGKKIVLLSNAPRQSHIVAEKLNSIGISATLYDHILSSGEATRLTLSKHPDLVPEGLGTTYFYIGPDRDSGLLDGLNYSVSNDLKASNFILATGPLNGSDALDSYDELLKNSCSLRLPMICANPDHLVVRQNGERLLCAGALAGRYEELGGRVVYFGKPHKEIYSICLTQLSEFPKSNILAIGDTLQTDIKGAQDFGLATTLVLGGVVAEELGISSGQMPSTSRLRNHCLNAGILPTYAVPMFVW